MKKAIVSGTHRLQLDVRLREEGDETVVILAKKPSTLTGDNDPWVDTMANFVRDKFKEASHLVIVNDESCASGINPPHEENDEIIRYTINLSDHLILANGRMPKLPALLAKVYYFALNQDGTPTVPCRFTSKKTGYPNRLSITEFKG